MRYESGSVPSYDAGAADVILARISSGESLAAICRDLNIPQATVYGWREKVPEFGERYIRARELQANAWAEQIVAIADEEEDPRRAQVRTDARKWVAARICHRTWGDRSKQEVEGNLTINVNTGVERTPDEPLPTAQDTSKLE